MGGRSRSINSSRTAWATYQDPTSKNEINLKKKRSY
jgi:hypothetical protein